MKLLKNFLLRKISKKFRRIDERKLVCIWQRWSIVLQTSKKKLNGGGSYIDLPKWLKNKKAAINPTQKDDACFLYTVAVAPIHEQIKSHPERIWNIKHFID